MGNQIVIPSMGNWYIEPLKRRGIGVNNVIESGTFFITLDCYSLKDPNQQMIVKAYESNEALEESNIARSCEVYFNQLNDLSKKVSIFGISTYNKIFLQNNLVFFCREKHQFTLSQRLEEYPPLENIEKKWISYRLLTLISSLHQITKSMIHGAINPDNVFVTWDLNVSIGDMAPFKPTYIKYNRPDLFHHFFTTASRGACYLAPEQLITSDSETDNVIFMFGSFSMDFFAAGLVIYYLYTGEHLLSFSQLAEISLALKKSRAKVDAANSQNSKTSSSTDAANEKDCELIFNKYIYDKIKNLPNDIIDLVKILLDLDPSRRLSEQSIIDNSTSTESTFSNDSYYDIISPFFPSIFKQISDQLNEFFQKDMKLEHMIKLIPTFQMIIDDSEERQKKENPNDAFTIGKITVSKRLKMISGVESKLILANVLTNSISLSKKVQEKSFFMNFICDYTLSLSENVKLSRVLPIFCDILSAPSNFLRSNALLCILKLVASLNVIPDGYECIFSNYLIKQIKQSCKGSSVQYRCSLAFICPKLAVEIERLSPESSALAVEMFNFILNEDQDLVIGSFVQSMRSIMQFNDEESISKSFVHSNEIEKRKESNDEILHLNASKNGDKVMTEKANENESKSKSMTEAANEANNNASDIGGKSIAAENDNEEKSISEATNEANDEILNDGNSTLKGATDNASENGGKSMSEATTDGTFEILNANENEIQNARDDDRSEKISASMNKGEDVADQKENENLNETANADQARAHSQREATVQSPNASTPTSYSKLLSIKKLNSDLFSDYRPSKCSFDLFVKFSHILLSCLNSPRTTFKLSVLSVLMDFFDRSPLSERTRFRKQYNDMSPLILGYFNSEIQVAMRPTNNGNDVDESETPISDSGVSIVNHTNDEMIEGYLEFFFWFVQRKLLDVMNMPELFLKISDFRRSDNVSIRFFASKIAASMPEGIDTMKDTIFIMDIIYQRRPRFSFLANSGFNKRPNMLIKSDLSSLNTEITSQANVSKRKKSRLFSNASNEEPLFISTLPQRKNSVKNSPLLVKAGLRIHPRFIKSTRISNDKVSIISPHFNSKLKAVVSDIQGRLFYVTSTQDPRDPENLAIEPIPSCFGFTKKTKMSVITELKRTGLTLFAEEETGKVKVIDWVKETVYDQFSYTFRSKPIKIISKQSNISYVLTESNELSVYDCRARSLSQTIQFDAENLTASALCGWPQNCVTLAVGFNEGLVQIVDTRMMMPISSILTEPAKSISPCFRNYCNFVVSSGQTVEVFDAFLGCSELSLDVKNAAVSPYDGNVILTSDAGVFYIDCENFENSVALADYGVVQNLGIGDREEIVVKRDLCGRASLHKHTEAISAVDHTKELFITGDVCGMLNFWTLSKF